MRRPWSSTTAALAKLAPANVNIAKARAPARLLIPSRRGASTLPLLLLGLGCSLAVGLAFAFAFASLAALRLQQGVEDVALAVLSGEVDDRPVGRLAEVGRVDQQALLAAFHLQGELGHRSVGDGFEGVADAPVLDRVDPSGQGDVDPAGVEGRDQ